MSDYVLVLNAGSSSLKFGVYARPEDRDWRLESRGQIEGIGTSPRMRAANAKGEILVDGNPADAARDCRGALGVLVEWLRSTYGGGRVVGVGHRVVHGGARYTRPVVLTPQVLADLYGLTPLAPLHQPHNLEAIEAVSEHLPGVPQVACFDTSFHRTLSAVAELVPLPRELRDAGVRRYGFHGLSYEYIVSALPRIAPELAQARVVVAHLGNGASLCALSAGRSVETTFGFTVLDGLCMGTRPGALDPGVVLFLFQNLGLSAREVETMLYHNSGLLAISGFSSDMRDLLASSRPEARLAIDHFVYRATREIGALAAVLGGIDGLVFTAGIGENSAEIRRRICASCAWLGIELDEPANTGNGPRISAPGSRVSVWVIRTDEEMMIARHTGTLLGLISRAASVDSTQPKVATMKATQLLHNLGQSLWLDNITRDLLDSGTLKRYRDEFSVTGLTSNPTIFEKAIKSSRAYDAPIREKLASGQNCEHLFFDLALEDLTRAADLFRPIYDRTNTVDGWVSLEVSPLLAYDTQSTLRAAKELFARANRPNLLIKIPGTREGLPAIEEAIFAGVPVNVTLLFSCEQYLDAAGAFLRGIERRLAAGLNPNVGSVASVFVSRWDAAVNDEVPSTLRNQLGIAIAMRTYKAARDLLTSPRWQNTYNAGARPQRLLWASTGTKDPSASDILYVKSLAAPFTVNTMPEATLTALAKHDQLGSILPPDGGDCEEVLAKFAGAGIDVDALAAKLQEDGAKSFAKSWNSLMDVIASKGALLQKAS